MFCQKISDVVATEDVVHSHNQDTDIDAPAADCDDNPLSRELPCLTLWGDGISRADIFDPMLRPNRCRPNGPLRCSHRRGNELGGVV